MAEARRLLVLTPDFPPVRGGIQVLVHRTVSHLPSLRPRVVTFAVDGAAAFDAGSELEVARVRTPVRSGPVGIGTLNARALAEAARFRPDAILSSHIFTSPAAALAARALRVPWVQHVYAMEMPQKPALARFAMRRADMVIAISEYSASLAVAAGAERGNVVVIPPGVDAPPADAASERNGEPLILTIARLDERYKGHDVMLRALPLIRARVPDAEWVVVGDGILRQSMSGLARSAGLDGAVRFEGPAPDEQRDAWLRRCRVFAMPSRLPGDGLAGEGFGIVYLEANAHGMPVVAGNVGGAVDAVEEDVTGLLVDPTDHVAVARAVATLLEDPARATRMGEAGIAHARSFSWSASGARVEEAITSLIAGR
jgi:phosphatidylinositol alpha-1,6-mannosyltransferase